MLESVNDVRLIEHRFTSLLINIKMAKATMLELTIHAHHARVMPSLRVLLKASGTSDQGVSRVGSLAD